MHRIDSISKGVEPILKVNVIELSLLNQEIHLKTLENIDSMMTIIASIQ